MPPPAGGVQVREADSTFCNTNRELWAVTAAVTGQWQNIFFVEKIFSKLRQCDKGAFSWVVVLVSISTATLEPPPPPDQGGEGKNSKHHKKVAEEEKKSEHFPDLFKSTFSFHCAALHCFQCAIWFRFLWTFSVIAKTRRQKCSGFHLCISIIKSFVELLNDES